MTHLSYTFDWIILIHDELCMDIKNPKNKHYLSTRMKQALPEEPSKGESAFGCIKCVQTMCFLNNSLDWFDFIKYLNCSQPIYKHV